jgi:uncharacterized protein
VRGFAALRLAALSLGLLCCVSGAALAQVAVPPLTGHVTDVTATLSEQQRASLEQTLAAFEARKGSQLAVLLIGSTAPETIEQYALRVAEQWKLGRKKVDDGLILLVAKEERTVRIEVGYGLEGAMSDITSKRIISETIVPRFKQGDFYGGIDAGMAQVMRVVDGEPLPPPVAAPARASGAGGLEQYAPLLFVLALGMGGVLRNMLGRFPGALLTGTVVGVVAAFVVGSLLLAGLAGVVAMLLTLVGGGRSGGLGGGLGGVGRGGGFGGGFGGGLGGGGFRGGGGGFGGGGASGRW